jgi:hypothetical protein
LSENDFLEFESGQSVTVEGGFDGGFDCFRDDLSGVVTNVWPQLLKNRVNPFGAFLRKKLINQFSFNSPFDLGRQALFFSLFSSICEITSF